jgi:hypothetical protein
MEEIEVICEEQEDICQNGKASKGLHFKAMALSTTLTTEYLLTLRRLWHLMKPMATTCGRKQWMLI